MPRTKYVLPIALLAASVLPAQVFQPVTCKNSFTPQQEQAEGEKVVAEVYKTMPVLPDSDPTSRYIQQLGARLVSVAPPTPGLEQQWPFRFHVVASEDINAFALPGGTMFVNLGAIQAAETEAQLAGVMGHEMSHVILRHSTCNITKQRSGRLLAGIGQIASQIILGGEAGQLGAAAIGAGASLSFLKMSREDEQQADLLGVQISHDAGFDPRGLPQFFEIIQAKYGAGGAQFLSDHPNPGNRTQYVNAEIAQLTPLNPPIKSTPAFTAEHARAANVRVYSAKDVQAGTWKSANIYASQPGTYNPPPANTSYPSQPAPPPYTPNQPTAAAAVLIAPLPAPARSLTRRLTGLQMPHYTLSYPAAWQVSGQQGDNATIAPAGASGSFGLAYGVVLGLQTIDPNNDQPTLAAATSSIASTLAQSSNLQQLNQPQSLTVAGLQALATTFRGTSPVAINGTAVSEKDVLITIQRNDGSIATIILVAPEQSFDTYRPAFDAILKNYRAN